MSDNNSIDINEVHEFRNQIMEDIKYYEQQRSQSENTDVATTIAKIISQKLNLLEEFETNLLTLASSVVKLKFDQVQTSLHNI